jgi:hypothetical protein
LKNIKKIVEYRSFVPILILPETENPTDREPVVDQMIKLIINKLTSFMAATCE